VADRDPHLVNMTAVVALGVATEIAGAVEVATGLSLKEIAALTTLANWADGQSIDRLRAVLGMSQPGCARLVDRLVDERLANRGADRADRRVTTVSITARGRRLVASARTARATAVLRWLDGLPPGAQRRLGPLLDELASARVRVSEAPAALANSQCRLCDPAACGYPDRCPTTQASRD
jgi:MarR family transcriptional repressor of emrRAB